MLFNVNDFRPNYMWLVIAILNFAVSLASWQIAGFDDPVTGLTAVFSLPLLVSLSIYLYVQRQYNFHTHTSLRPICTKDEALNLPLMPAGADKMTVKRTVRTEEIIVNNDHNLNNTGGAGGDGSCRNVPVPPTNLPMAQTVQERRAFQTQVENDSLMPATNDLAENLEQKEILPRKSQGGSLGGSVLKPTIKKAQFRQRQSLHLQSRDDVDEQAVRKTQQNILQHIIDQELKKKMKSDNAKNEAISDNTINNAIVQRTKKPVSPVVNRQEDVHKPKNIDDDMFTEERQLLVHEITNSSPTSGHESSVVQVALKNNNKLSVKDSQQILEEKPVFIPVALVPPQCPQCVSDHKSSQGGQTSGDRRLLNLPKPQSAMAPVTDPTVDVIFKLEDARYRYEPSKDKFPVAFQMEDARYGLKANENIGQRQQGGSNHEAQTSPWIETYRLKPEILTDLRLGDHSENAPMIPDIDNNCRPTVYAPSVSLQHSHGFAVDSCEALWHHYRRLGDVLFDGNGIPSWLIQLSLAIPLILVVSLIQTDILPPSVDIFSAPKVHNCVEQGSCSGQAGFFIGVGLTMMSLGYMYFRNKSNNDNLNVTDFLSFSFERM